MAQGVSTIFGTRKSGTACSNSRRIDRGRSRMTIWQKSHRTTIILRAGTAQFKPGWGNNEIRGVAAYGLSLAKEKGRLRPKQLNGFIFDTGVKIGASDGKITTWAQLQVNDVGDVYVFPYPAPKYTPKLSIEEEATRLIALKSFNVPLK